jgi:hypothetical protein
LGKVWVDDQHMALWSHMLIACWYRNMPPMTQTRRLYITAVISPTLTIALENTGNSQIPTGYKGGGIHGRSATQQRNLLFADSAPGAAIRSFQELGLIAGGESQCPRAEHGVTPG